MVSRVWSAHRDKLCHGLDKCMPPLAQAGDPVQTVTEALDNACLRSYSDVMNKCVHMQTH